MSIDQNEDAPATKQDVKDALKNQSLLTTLGIPILVAVVTGLVSIGGQMYIARSVKEDEAIGTAAGVARANFYNQAKVLLETIDTSFEEICYFPLPKKTVSTKEPPKERDALSTALHEYRRHVANAPDGLDDPTRAALKEYSEFVANSQFEIRAGSLKDEQKKDLDKRSKILLQGALAALKESSRKPAFTAGS